jgi:serine/threonine protein kinase
MEGGDLLHWLEKHENDEDGNNKNNFFVQIMKKLEIIAKHLYQKGVFDIMNQVLKGVAHLHSNNVCHRGIE